MRVLDPELRFYSGYVRFTLSGYVNSHSNRNWPEENPQAVQHVRVHDTKNEVW
jgi:hypothetical protein